MYTGNTSSSSSIRVLISVYPCVYREHITLTSTVACCSGLSLCIQGTLMRKKLTYYCTRFIPVYTGNTPSNLISFIPCPVYPCVYREHMILGLVSFMIDGLSLCIQGTPIETPPHPRTKRFIPVHTGNTYKL